MGGNVIIGSCSGNIGNRDTQIISEDDQPSLHSPMGNTVNYNNIEIHIGLFGISNKFDVNKTAFRPSASRFTAFLCSWALLFTLAASTPTTTRRELTEDMEWSDNANVIQICEMKYKRRKPYR